MSRAAAEGGSELDALASDLERRLPGRVRRDVRLERLTTYRIGGPAAVYCSVTTGDELEVIRELVAPRRVPILVVGRGSNLLVADRGFPGVAVHLEGAFERLSVENEPVLAGGAVALPRLARQTAASGRSGLEFFVGIPGSVGGAVRMNAGGHGSDTAGVLVRAWLVDLRDAGGGECEADTAGLGLGYRTSAVGEADVVTRAEFAAVGDDPGACRRRIDEVVQWRREHQPGGSNAGSVFTNPPGDAAGRIIDACGLKGLRVGGARVSAKHANFFQASPGARAGDVRALILEVQRHVEEATGVCLVPEIRMVGFDAEDDT